MPSVNKEMGVRDYQLFSHDNWVAGDNLADRCIDFPNIRSSLVPRREATHRQSWPAHPRQYSLYNYSDSTNSNSQAVILSGYSDLTNPELSWPPLREPVGPRLDQVTWRMLHNLSTHSVMEELAPTRNSPNLAAEHASCPSHLCRGTPMARPDSRSLTKSLCLVGYPVVLDLSLSLSVEPSLSVILSLSTRQTCLVYKARNDWPQLSYSFPPFHVALQQSWPVGWW